MAFHEVRLPARLAFGSTGGIERRTEITMLTSGHERRTTPWAMGRRRYLIGANLRSLDDMGKTGWYVVAPYVASIALSIIGVVMMFGGMAANGFSEDYYEGNPAAALALMGPAMGLFGLALLAGFVFLLWIGLVDSQKGENRFGPNPKGE